MPRNNLSQVVWPVGRRSTILRSVLSCAVHFPSAPNWLRVSDCFSTPVPIEEVPPCSVPSIPEHFPGYTSSARYNYLHIGLLLCMFRALLHNAPYAPGRYLCH